MKVNRLTKAIRKEESDLKSISISNMSTAHD